MKNFVFIAILFCFLIPRADTITYNGKVLNWKEGNNFYAKEQWRSALDSIKSVVDDGLDNGNIQSNAAISYTKMDSTGTAKATKFKGDSLRLSSYGVLDSANIRAIKGTTYTGNVIGAVTGTADSAKGCNHLTGGSVNATTGTFSSTLTADSLNVHGTVIQKNGWMGIGRSPLGQLHVLGSGGSAEIRSDCPGTSSIAYFHATNGTSDGYFGVDNSTGVFVTGSLPYALVLDQAGAYPLQLATTNIVRVTVRSSGIVNLSNVPVYADQAAAAAGGLVAGDLYQETGSNPRKICIVF